MRSLGNTQALQTGSVKPIGYFKERCLAAFPSASQQVGNHTLEHGTKLVLWQVVAWWKT